MVKCLCRDRAVLAVLSHKFDFCLVAKNDWKFFLLILLDFPGFTCNEHFFKT